MVKGKTKSGIKFEIDERIKDDARLLFLLTMLQSDKVELDQKGQHVFDLFSMVFGTEGVMPFMNEVADKHDGICSTDVMIEELNDIFEAINAKK